VDELAMVYKLDHKDAKAMVDRVLNSISRSLACGEPVTLRNFGKFETRSRRAGTRRNPMTGDSVEVPEKMTVGFVAAPALKARVNPQLEK
jgi:nucleoid DNA-binding protein